MYTISKPVTEKDAGVICYVFDVKTDKKLEIKNQIPALASTNLPLEISTHYTSDLNRLLQDFIHQTKSYFSKPYSLEQVKKVLHHSFQISPVVETPDIFHNISLVPQKIRIKNGEITVIWLINGTPVLIDFPDLIDTGGTSGGAGSGAGSRS
jgi:hypothetical protein